MAKTAKRHRCIDCGSTTARWAGRCPTCGEWNTLVEEAQLGSLVQAVDALGLETMPLQLSVVDMSEAEVLKRIKAAEYPGWPGAFIEIGGKRFYHNAPSTVENKS